jgi:hypothetical protein
MPLLIAIAAIIVLALAAGALGADSRPVSQNNRQI